MLDINNNKKINTKNILTHNNNKVCVCFCLNRSLLRKMFFFLFWLKSLLFIFKNNNNMCMKNKKNCDSKTTTRKII